MGKGQGSGGGWPSQTGNPSGADVPMGHQVAAKVNNQITRRSIYECLVSNIMYFRIKCRVK